MAALWTDKEITLLKKLCGSGKYDWKLITPHFPGRTHKSITNYARKNGIKNMKNIYKSKGTKGDIYREPKISAAGVELIHASGTEVWYE